MPPKFCGQCGERLTPDQRFCERCGNPLVAGAVAPEIPKTRLSMKRPEVSPKKPAVSPTIPMPPSQPGLTPAPTPQPWAPASTPSPTPRRRRRWPWIVLGLLALFVGSAVGGWFAAPVVTHGLAARFGVPTGDGDAEVAAWPIDEDGEEPGFDVRLAPLSSSPPGSTLATPVFRIAPRDADTTGPFEVSLPLFDARDGRLAVMGHFHDGAWEPLASEVVDGRLVAVTDTFSDFAGWYPEEGGARSAYDASRLQVAPPRLLYGEVTSEGPSLVFDLRGLTHARDRAWGRPVRVASLHVEVNQPEGDLASPRADHFETYVFDGAPLRWSPRGEPIGRLPISRVPLSRRYDQVTPVRYRRWEVRVVPVFDDGTSGPPSSLVEVYPDPLRAIDAMNRELPLEPARRAQLDERIASHPLRVVYGGYFRLQDAYNGSLGWSRRRGWGRLFGGIAGPHIGLTLDATYGGTLTHEWGHYAAHMALGDGYENDSPGGAHNGWVESTRALAFTEDLATLLGQWATGVGVPPAAGAMLGRTRAMSRTPEGNAGPYWPTHREQDAAAVETVPATVLSRLAHAIGFPALFEIIAADPPRDLVAFVDAADAHREALQPILLDEGVSWIAEGRVVRVSSDGAPPTPVEGATVRVRTLAGVELVAPTVDLASVHPTTGADGRFSVRVPQGEVVLVAEKAGLSQRARVTFVADAAQRTTAEAQPLPSDIEMEQGLELIVESPVDGASVSERILVVRGRVERRDGDAIETVTLSTAGGEVQAPLQGDRFEGRVTLTPGDNTITASAQSGEAVASASVTVRADIPATVLMCELTWDRDGTDVDLWVTDPEDVTTGFRNRHPREGRLLDVDNTRGYGPETFTMSADVSGAYQVRVNYYAGRGPVAFRVRWCVREATPQARCDEETATLTASDHNGSTPAGNHRFTVQVPPRR